MSAPRSSRIVKTMISNVYNMLPHENHLYNKPILTLVQNFYTFHNGSVVDPAPTETVQSQEDQQEYQGCNLNVKIPAIVLFREYGDGFLSSTCSWLCCYFPLAWRSPDFRHLVTCRGVGRGGGGIVAKKKSERRSSPSNTSGASVVPESQWSMVARRHHANRKRFGGYRIV